MRKLRAGLAVLIALGAAHGALAQPGERPAARFVHERGEGAEACPDDGELRDAVSARLGYDPFRDDATRTVVVRFDARGRGLAARLDLPTDDGRTRRREFTSAAGDCEELARSVALALSLAIDPMNPGPDAPPAVPAPIVDPVAAPPPPPPAPTRRDHASGEDEDARAVRVRLGAVGRAALGTAPSLQAGFGIEPGVRAGAFSVSLDGRVELPVENSVAGGARTEVSALALALRPCGHWDVLVACVLGSLGSLSARGAGVDQPREASALAGKAGIATGVEVPLGEAFAFGARAELYAALSRATLVLDGVEVWEQPALAAALAIGAIGTLP